MFRKQRRKSGRASVRSRRPDSARLSEPLSFEKLEARHLLATFVVNSSADLPVDLTDSVVTLRDAIQAANDDMAVSPGGVVGGGEDTIIFDSTVFSGGAASLVRLTQGELEITDSLTINGSTGVDVTITGDASGDDIVDTSNITDVEASFGDLLDDNSRVLHFSANAGDLSLHDLTVTGGFANQESQGGEEGGGVLFSSGGELRLVDSLFSGNSAFGRNAAGGAIAGGTLERPSGPIVLQNSTVSGNGVYGSDATAGGIYSYSRSPVTLIASEVSDNIGIGIVALSSVTLANSSVDGNTATGVLVFDGEVVLTGSTVSGNGNGGIITAVASVALTNSTVSGNTSEERGGGISTVSGVVTLTASTVNENVSDGDGGGVSSLSGVVTLTASTVNGNVSEGNGGGVSSRSGAVALTSSTVSGNNSGDRGGGISAGSGAVIISSTITENLAGESGGGLFVSNPNLTIENSIIAGNTESGASVDLQASLRDTVTINHSLIGVVANLGTFEGGVGNQFGTVDAPLDPRLGPLADNGGPTQSHVPLSDSLAIDSGVSDLEFDQRGFARAFDVFSVPDLQGTAVDIGSVERHASLSTFVPSNLSVDFGALSGLDLSATRIIEESGEEVTLTLTANAGEFALPISDGGVIAALSSPQVVTLVGTALDINIYLDNDSNLQYTPAVGLVGEDVATIALSVNSEQVGVVNVDVTEPRSLVVTTAEDVTADDGQTSLREAIASANSDLDSLPDQITFDSSVFTGGDASLIRLTQGELEITDALTIDGSTGVDVTITGDANGDDVTDAANITDVDASFGGVVGDSSDLLDDNSRVLRFEDPDGGLTLIDLTITGGRTESGSGAGVLFNAGGSQFTLVNSSVSGNRSSSNGGGIDVFGGALTLTGSTVSGNVAEGNYGGGIDASIGALTLASSTISGNRATVAGGGIFGFGGLYDNISLTDTTITGNDAGVGGGVSFIGSRYDFSITNSIIAGNTAAETDPDFQLSTVDGSTLTINHSLIGIADNLGAVTGNIGNLLGTTTRPVDPHLLPLADNGGPTRTHALLPGSPAVNAGFSTEAFDQRGAPFSRDDGSGVDIGAFEFGFPTPEVAPTVVSFQVDEGGVLARPDLWGTLTVAFDQDVSITDDALSLVNDTLGGVAVDLGRVAFDYDPTSFTATWTFDSSDPLDAAFYTYTLDASMITAGGLQLDSNGDGTSGDDLVAERYVAIPGDANLDGDVDFRDASGFFIGLGAASVSAGDIDLGWSSGNFNGDRTVNILGDAFALIGNFGQSVIPPVVTPETSLFIRPNSNPDGASVAALPVEFVAEEDKDEAPVHLQRAEVLQSSQPQLAGHETRDLAFEEGIEDDSLVV